jgi:hypothetical protein
VRPEQARPDAGGDRAANSRPLSRDGLALACAALKRVLLTAAVALGVVPASASAALPGFRGSLITPGRSVAGVSIGQSTAKAIKSWGGNKTCQPLTGLTQCVWTSNNGKLGTVTLNFHDGKVDYIGLQLSNDSRGNVLFRGPLMKLKTKKGIGMHSDDAQLVKAYGSQVGTGVSGPTLGSGSHTTTFATSAGRYVSIIIGPPQTF